MVNGANDRGGFRYAAGVVNGGDITDDNVAKDFYGQASYKIGGMSVVKGTAEATETSDFWRDDNILLGVFGYSGTHKLDGGKENKVQLFGGDIDLWFSDLNLFGAFAHRNDDDPYGGDSVMVGVRMDDKDTTVAWFGEVKSDAFFVEADYLIYPWLIPLVRYEWERIEMKNGADRGEITRQMVIPAIVVMVRANVKLTLEGQIRLDEKGKDAKAHKAVLGVDFGF